ncbi:MAG: hypothetical protein ACKVIF_07690, partial [Rhodospirillales bacterium]
PISRLYPGNAKLENLLLIAVTETTTDIGMKAFTDGLTEVLR